MNKCHIIIVFLLSVNGTHAMCKTGMQSSAHKVDNDEMTQVMYPLHAAIFAGNLWKLQILLTQSHIRSIIDAAHMQMIGHPTALHEACRIRSSPMVNLLLNAGANTEVRTMPDGTTPLSLLIKNLHNQTQDENVAELLLDSGANVNVSDGEGDTPLHHACKAGSAYMVALLMRYGAIEESNNEQKLPREYASQNVAIQTLLQSDIKRSMSIKIPSRKAHGNFEDEDARPQSHLVPVGLV